MRKEAGHAAVPGEEALLVPDEKATIENRPEIVPAAHASEIVRLSIVTADGHKDRKRVRGTRIPPT